MEGLVAEIVKGLGLVLGGGALAEIVRQIFVSGDAKNIDRAKLNDELWERVEKQDKEIDTLKKQYWELYGEHSKCQSETAELRAENARLTKRIERLESTQSRLARSAGLIQEAAT